MNCSEKVALVTGTTRGIGRAIALKLGQQGVYVVGTATSEAGVAKIESTFSDAGIKGEAVKLDVTSISSIEAVVDRLTEQKKAPAILVNNAGITADDLLLRMENADWGRVIETNLTAVFRLTQACLKPMFRSRWGRIVNLGSVVGSSGSVGQVNYAAAKAGIVGFSKSLAQEIASRGITINVVAPGFIDTDMTASLPQAVKDEILKKVPMKRLGQPTDIAEAVAFLASDGAAYITGSTLHVNGGLYMN